MLVVISDTSPLRCLAHLGRLPLLEQLFSSVFIPPAVLAELRSPLRDDMSQAVLGMGCIRVQAPIDINMVSELQIGLDTGESEAIALASELHADVVLIDEKRGRAECSRRGLATMGVLGLLARAKLRGLIPEVGPLMDALSTSGGFFISPALRQAVLRQCGEEDQPPAG